MLVGRSEVIVKYGDMSEVIGSSGDDKSEVIIMSRDKSDSLACLKAGQRLLSHMRGRSEVIVTYGGQLRCRYHVWEQHSSHCHV